MNNNIRRVFVEKRKGFDQEAIHLFKELKETLEIDSLIDVRVINRYDVRLEGFEEFEFIKKTVLSEPNADNVWESDVELRDEETPIAIEYLPGQYDQRADWASQGIRIITHGKDVKVKSARIVVLEGKLTAEELDMVKDYLINPVDSREASMEMPRDIDDETVLAEDVQEVEGFVDFSSDELEGFRKSAGFAMSADDVVFVQKYFKETEKRNPTETELRVIDTYWSDHCRHTTFLTEITDVKINEGKFSDSIKRAYMDYQNIREELYPAGNRPLTLMDLATVNMKFERKRGNLQDLDQSEEINACSIDIDVDVDGKDQKWLLMFKNETHNHPTEIEPFGGAATCLGGAIRDPLSGRSYVYQAMRVTGAADPRKPVKDTLKGKLPQRKICREAAKGFSSYGNQIGLATGQVTEIYDEGYVAKRMEIGAVMGAAPKDNVVRERPQPGDIVLLIGGRTGRDGCGGATGSSKSHTEESINESGAEVQKGNPPEERKIQRLFRNPEVSRMIKRCNDFGAGGVSVAIGELADSLEIDLDLVPKKYNGLDGTELAISESQERMAVVVSAKDVERFLGHASLENIEGTAVAKVTDTGRLVMKWRGNPILDLSREFLDTNGAKQYSKVELEMPDEQGVPVGFAAGEKEFADRFEEMLSDLNVCSQQGLSEMFDSTIGAGTVLMPFGGKNMVTPPDGMAAKIPLTKGETHTCSLMAFGYQPELSKWSPFHGGVYSIVEAACKIAAIGGDVSKIRFSLQEYFEKLGSDPKKWGKPFSALLGAFHAQKELGLAAIGGKDSMSGSFGDINVPPTLVSFAVTVDKTQNIVTPEFKGHDSIIYSLSPFKNQDQIPDFIKLKEGFSVLKNLMDQKTVISAKAVGKGGMAEALAKMSFGNSIGVVINEDICMEDLFSMDIGGLAVEVTKDNKENFLARMSGFKMQEIGVTTERNILKYQKTEIDLSRSLQIWKEPLSKIYPEMENEGMNYKNFFWNKGPLVKSGNLSARPKVFVPVFPGTNCEYDSIRAFEKAGASVESFVFRNLSASDIEDSLSQMAEKILKSQIIMFPGGFSAGDEPEGSAKFIAAIFRNSKIRDSVMEMLSKNDGLILGICNGFQALVKLGLLPYGDIREIGENDPTLTFNTIGRHISQVSETEIISNLSPWLSNVRVGDRHMVALSHGEGRFVADDETLNSLAENGQLATRYAEENPNGSVWAIEGITSPDGRIFGKMGHSERIGKGLYKNIYGEMDQKIFEAGVSYFK
ncbi:phosphoribosylformylglycinamidine synthase [Alkalibacter mobilis]|uniref:phosphoribosylformylglycinamidine synthase n=1 Tax=Alkalibacter mobilis TaxID=2787712 RepID=UPI00189E7D53|nr:phosphoribosylformylglycinamidine synthase [Alkalibacter mobilis]MBF7096928.1 phosphoribosylformylglycinamidine synthase [Alkalibacter mobilis]